MRNQGRVVRLPNGTFGAAFDPASPHRNWAHSQRWNEHASAGIESRGQLLALVKKSLEQEAGAERSEAPCIRPPDGIWGGALRAGIQAQIDHAKHADVALS